MINPRNSEEVLNSLIETKESDINLSGLTSTSETALWKNQLSVFAVAISFFEQVFQSFEKDLQYQKDTTPIYTAQWFRDRMINFYQFSDTDPEIGQVKVNDNFEIFYETEDVDARIIEYCAVTQEPNSRQVTVKIAKDNGSGQPEVLTTDELVSATSFVGAIQGAGLLVSTVSFPGDLLFVDIDIYYDGQFAESTTKDNVNNAIIDYLNNTEFDGGVRELNLVNSIETVPGVKDVVVNRLQAQKNGDTSPLDWNRLYFTKAGYMNYNPDNSVINMIIE